MIPLRTVLAEELFFRGVLVGGLDRLYGRRVGVLAASVLFGLWHAVTSLGLTTANSGLGGLLGTGLLGRIVGVVGAVLATSLAGLLLGWLRLRSRSLLTPIALHWAANGFGAVGAAAAWQLSGG